MSLFALLIFLASMVWSELFGLFLLGCHFWDAMASPGQTHLDCAKKKAHSLLHYSIFKASFFVFWYEKRMRSGTMLRLVSPTITKNLGCFLHAL